MKSYMPVIQKEIKPFRHVHHGSIQDADLGTLINFKRSMKQCQTCTNSLILIQVGKDLLAVPLFGGISIRISTMERIV